MTYSLNTDDPISFFLSVIEAIRVNILDNFVLPGLDITYWDFVISVAAASIVVTGCLACVRIGGISIGRSIRNRRRDSPQKTKGD